MRPTMEEVSVTGQAVYPSASMHTIARNLGRIGPDKRAIRRSAVRAWLIPGELFECMHQEERLVYKD